MATMEQPEQHPSSAAWVQWAILAVATTILAIAAGGRFLVGLVFDEMQQHFHMTHGGLGSVVSISVLMVGLGQPLVGWLVDRFSARVVAAGGLLLLGTGLIVVSQAGSGLGLVLGYGVLTGLGLATLTPTVMTPVVAAWFERRRTTALSIISAANPMGQSLVVPALALLVAATGWQDGYFLLGLLVAAVGAPLIFVLLREQRRIAPDLLRRGPALREAVDAGLPVLAVCGGYQLFGHRYVDHDGSVIPGIGVFDAETRHPGPVADRCIGDIVVETPFGEVVGFENHGGRTYLAPGQEPLGTVRLGRGNNAEDRTEGARRHNAIGTYLHGSVLPKNPALADALILAALRRRYGPSVELPPLDDAPERRAHEAALRTALARARRPA